MRNGFTFKGIHTDKFGAVVKSKSKTLLPEVKSYTYDIPNMDGEYDFTTQNEFGRAFYRDRTFELSLQISADSFRELNKKAARLAIWLSGEGELIFDESDGVIWDAKCISGASFSPERRGKSAVISVIMKSTATGKASFDTLSGIALSDAPSLLADIPLDFSQYFTFEAPANTVFIPNMGDWWVRPVIKLECEEAIGDIDIAFGKKELHISSAPENARIDCENFTVTGGNQNLLGYMKGSFFELPPGGGYMSVSVQNPCTVQILYTPKTIYDFDFEAVKWGDDNA